MEDAHALAETISSAEAVPGSGWVAAVSASLAAGLVAKTAARSEGWSGAEGARAQAIDLRDRLLALADPSAVPPYDPGRPCEIKVEFKWTGPVAELKDRPGIEAVDPRTIVSRADDWWTAWKQFYF